MSDETNDQSTGQEGVAAPVDPIAEVRRMNEELQKSLINLKSEMNRKIDSLKPAAPPAEPPRPLNEVFYENPDLAMDTMEKTIEARITSRFEEREQSRNLAAKLYSDYPELEDANNPLTQRANEIFESLSPGEKKDPRALKTAVLEAATEFGLAPKPKRKSVQSSDSDNFSLGSKGNSKPRGKKEEVSDNMLQTAALMGLDVKDPKVIERLQSRTKRSYGKFGE